MSVPTSMTIQNEPAAGAGGELRGITKVIRIHLLGTMNVKSFVSVHPGDAEMLQRGLTKTCC